MSPPTTRITVSVSEMAEVKAALDQAAATVKVLMAERDEWKRRYEELSRNAAQRAAQQLPGRDGGGTA